MRMFCDITEIADTLDDVIDKGLSIKDNNLRKGLTFDPFDPVTMSEQSNFYNPYQWVDNGYMPHPVEHWREQGKGERDEYAEVHKLYDQINFRRSAFKSLTKALDTDLVKAGAVPVGTVHTYTNGVKYKKVADGQWAPVKDPSKPMTGHQDIEAHASNVTKIQEQIKAKTKEAGQGEEYKDAAKREAQKAVMEAMKQMYGGELPPMLKQHFDKIGKQNAMADQEKGKDAPTKLKEVEAELKPKKHDVSVEFTHNGQNYNHHFPAVLGSSKEEVSGRIAELVKKKIPGAVIGKMNVEPKEEKAKGASPKQNWKDKQKDVPSAKKLN